MKKQILILALLLPLLAGCTAKQPEPLPCTPGEAQRLVVYTSHKEEVYTPIIREFEERTGIWVDVVSGGTNELLQRLQSGGRRYLRAVSGGVRLLDAFFRPARGAGVQYQTGGPGVLNELEGSGIPGFSWKNRLCRPPDIRFFLYGAGDPASDGRWDGG